MVIGVDIDGVLFPWEDAVRDAARTRWDVELGELDTWDAFTHELGPERWAWLWTPEGVDAVLRQTWRTYPGAIEAVRAIIEAGHSVHFVTHRAPGTAASWTASYIGRHFHGLRFDGLHVLSSSVPKRKLARWDVFIDDKPETVWDFLDNTTARVFSPVRPWNVEELEEYPGGELVHYIDPADIVRWVERHG